MGVYVACISRRLKWTGRMRSSKAKRLLLSVDRRNTWPQLEVLKVLSPITVPVLLLSRSSRGMLLGWREGVWGSLQLQHLWLFCSPHHSHLTFSFTLQKQTVAWELWKLPWSIQSLPGRSLFFIIFFQKKKKKVSVDLTLWLYAFQVFLNRAWREMHSSNFPSSRNSFSSGIKNMLPPSKMPFSVLFICASK